VKALPVLTRPKVSTDLSSVEIDRRVKAILEKALSVYEVHSDLLKELRPSHIVTQTQCEVCAVSLKDVEQALFQWTESKPAIVPLAPNALTDVWSDIQRVADALGVSERGRRLIQHSQNRMERTAEEAKKAAVKPRVASIEWIDPLMSGGNWAPTLIEMAGGINLFGEAGKHSPWMNWEDLQSADPDVLFIFPCGFDIARTRRELPALTKRPGWNDLKAVRSGRVYLMDGNQYFNRPGPRLVESLEILAEALHPDLFHFGHEKNGWERLGFPV
jgi:iron complex transport system substrate-binding protein